MKRQLVLHLSLLFSLTVIPQLSSAGPALNNPFQSAASAIGRAFGYQNGNQQQHELRGGGEVQVESVSAMGLKLPAAYAPSSTSAAGPTTGPTTKSNSQALTAPSYSVHSYGVGVPDEYFPVPVEEGPLAETMRLVQMQERAMLVQASRCRAAVYRLGVLQRIMQGRGSDSRTKPKDIAQEVARWKSTTIDMQRQLSACLNTAGRDVANLLGEKSPAPLQTHEKLTPQLLEEAASVDGPTVRAKDGTLASKKPEELSVVAAAKEEPKGSQQHSSVHQQPAGTSKTWSEAQKEEVHTSISPAKDPQVSVFSAEVEGKYRVATYWDIPVYGALPLPDTNKACYEYAGDTELHLVWDVDQSKLVGEGTNDVELVIKCVLWWKEELSHDPHFVPHKVPKKIKEEFQEYCRTFDLKKAFDSVIHLLVRPGAKEFVKAHPQAKWWTFTNKDRAVDGQIVRDVSDDDGLVGKYQGSTHEVSGKPVVDANKYALKVLDECACAYLGINNEMRPLIGVRGQRKDMARVAHLIANKRGAETKKKPATVVLIDDRKCDAYGKCQVNDERLLCHIPAYNAISEEKAKELVAAMEALLPVNTLLKFYKAFQAADPSHALVQCVDIMSDDQSMLLKKRIQDKKNVFFEYVPKMTKGDPPPSLPVFKRDHCRKW